MSLCYYSLKSIVTPISDDKFYHTRFVRHDLAKKKAETSHTFMMSTTSAIRSTEYEVVSELMRLHVAKEKSPSSLHAVAGCSEENVET